MSDDVWRVRWNPKEHREVDDKGIYALLLWKDYERLRTEIAEANKRIEELVRWNNEDKADYLKRIEGMKLALKQIHHAYKIDDQPACVLSQIALRALNGEE